MEQDHQPHLADRVQAELAEVPGLDPALAAYLVAAVRTHADAAGDPGRTSWSPEAGGAVVVEVLAAAERWGREHAEDDTRSLADVPGREVVRALVGRLRGSRR